MGKSKEVWGTQVTTIVNDNGSKGSTTPGYGKAVQKQQDYESPDSKYSQNQRTYPYPDGVAPEMDPCDGTQKQK